MSGTLLTPVHVSARVVSASSVVAPPLGTGKPPVTLAHGVHVHWALPDALTRAKVRKKGTGDERHVLFPSAPDLWLVVRFLPVAGAPAVSRGVTAAVPAISATATAALGTAGQVAAAIAAVADRGWRGWIVESRTRRHVDLASWTNPTDPAYVSTQVQTVAGVLEAADDLGHPGWGLWPEGAKAFEPAQAAYYPEAQNVFGLHDPLDDLPGATGRVSYVVVGWYRFPINDPVRQAFNRDALLESWKLDWKPTSSPASHIFAPAAKAASPAPAPVGLAPLAAARKAAGARLLSRANELAIAVNGATATSAVIDASAATMTMKGPDHLSCHGAVLGVNIAAPAGARKGAGTLSVHVVPSLQRALAEVAAGESDDEDWKATVEAMIQDADQKSATTAGLLTMPNDVHALGFQSRPGKSTSYAQLSIKDPHTRLLQTANMAARTAVEYWPAAAMRAIKGEKAAVMVRPMVPSVNPLEPPKPPPPPSEGELGIWTGKVQQSIVAVNATGAPVDARFLRVTDHRHALPAHATVGPAPSPTGRQFWVDMDDPAAMADLLVMVTGAHVIFPTRETVWEVPGPRWYRPWSPHLILQNIGRSFRFGFDGRFDPDGHVRCRMSGSTLTSINTTISNLTPTPVAASELLGNAAALVKAGLPAVARPLVEEALLLDSDNAHQMASIWLQDLKKHVAAASVPAAAEVETAFRNQIRGNWMLRKPDLDEQKRDVIEKSLQYNGVMPSPIGFIPWEQPWEPLFANVTYSYEPAHPGQLGPVELTLGAKEGAPVQATERRPLAATVSKVLDSAIVSKLVLDGNGKLVPANGPNGFESDDFLRLDVLSTALAGFDDGLFDKGLRMRAGSLRIDQVEVVDAMGSTELVKAPAQIPPVSPFRTDLAPRLPSWSRVQFRLMSAINEGEANVADSPVCGYLIPDFVEHALEVYAADGEALGQLRQLPNEPTHLHTAGTIGKGTPGVEFEPHPWHAHPLGDPTGVITNRHLKAFVAGVCNAEPAELDGPKAPVPGQICESALTAMLRIIDTLRATIDPQDKHGGHRVRMVGAPIALVRAHTWVERTAAHMPKGDPPLLADPLTVNVKVGTATQPDDGVLGCFIRPTVPGGKDAHFRPVDTGAFKALSNGLLDAVGPALQPVFHKFVHDPAGEDTTFALTTGQERDLLLLLDIQGSIYVTSGVLPRKKIALPREFLEGALEKLQPSFRVGPLLSVGTGEDTLPILPVPSVTGYDCQFVETGHAEGVVIPPLPADGVLPVQRCQVVEGWLNLLSTRD